MTRLHDLLPADWQAVLSREFEQEYFHRLEDFLAEETAARTIFPPREDIFRAFRLTPYRQAKVLLLGQDPYHDHGQAQGLCFSVPEGVRPPPSLRNMYKEMASDLDLAPPAGGNLEFWAEQGILLLNACLTVRAHQPLSHRKKGWEIFTDAVIAALSRRQEPLIFVLWGNYAAAKEKLIDAERHFILKSAHPSPLSASRGFFGSRPYSRINARLQQLGRTPIIWSYNQPAPVRQPEFGF
ncbi:MAG: uracil-DNA glycosylase [Victivallales bacterium]|nr:uracil-DNA glycosylase [Victivallales bacterium]